MSGTTVIASAHGASLYVTPFLRPKVDVPAIDRVLARYRLARVEGGPLPVEFIVSRELDPHTSASLARDLRELGLVVRVVPRGDITQSARIGQALLVPVMIGGFASLGLTWGMVLPLPAWFATLGAMFLSAAGIHSLLSFLALSSAARLPVLAAEPPPASLVGDVSELVAGLPEHVARPLLERARDLEARARQNPDGAAARELERMREDLAEQRERDDERTAQELRRDLAQARAAMHEASRNRG